jgi:hypothetical protein
MSSLLRREKVQGQQLSRLFWSEQPSMWFCDTHPQEFLVFSHQRRRQQIIARCPSCDRENVREFSHAVALRPEASL